MTLSIINSKLSRDLPPWSIDTLILEPFREGGRHFLQALVSSTAQNGTTPRHRVLHLIAAASLLFPLVNHIVYIALRYFVKPPSIRRLSLPDNPICASSFLEAEGRLGAAVRSARNAVARVQNEVVRVTISDYVEFIEKSGRKLIDVQTADNIIQLIYESVADELENIASQIDRISFDNFSNITESPEALAWQQAIWHALQSFDPEEVERLIRRGQEKQFLNQPFYSWFGATFFIHIAKSDRDIRYLPLLKECNADPNLRENFGNTGLIWACANAGNGSAREILRVFGRGPYLDAQCRQGNTALHLLVGKGYKKKSCEGATLACSNLELLRIVIALKADVNLPDKAGNTPLHLAYLRRDCEMVQALLGAGANTEMTNQKGQRPAELLKMSYEEACEILRGSATVFLLDRAEFQNGICSF
jgi:ankyrin repeat protein